MVRPVIQNYQELSLFIKDMIAFRKRSERHFSVLKVTKRCRRLSPSLISLIIGGQRRVTLDRTDELAKLLGLTPMEKQYLKDWVGREEGDLSGLPPTQADQKPRGRKSTSSHIIKDWINVFVKDAFGLDAVRKNPKNIYKILGGISSQKRIDGSIKFLLREGYLRRTLSGDIVEDTPLNVIDRKIPDTKVRQFHKGTLRTAIGAVDQYPTDQRYANALIVPLDEASYAELIALIAEFAERLQDFAEHRHGGERLYQLIINLSPTGGRHV